MLLVVARDPRSAAALSPAPPRRAQRHYRVVPALGGAIGWLVSWRGITARLARENSVRQPGRTLVTALALTVGLGLVAFISVLAAGTKTTIDQAVSRSFAGNLIVQNTQSGQGLPAAVAPTRAHGPRRRRGHGGRLHQGHGCETWLQPGAPVIDEKSTVTAIEPESFVKMYKIEWEHGSPATLAALGPDGTVDHQEVRERPPPARRAAPVGADAIGPGRDADGRRASSRKKCSACSPTSRSRARWRARRSGNAKTESTSSPTRPAPTAPKCATASTRCCAPTSRRPTHRPRRSTRSEVSSKVNKFLLLVYVLLALSVIVSLVRNRQHADPLDLRAHPRAGHDARDRHLAPPDPADDPLRVADHRR